MFFLKNRGMAKKEKILGILGGMGPYATLHFLKQILDVTPAKKDWEHLRLLIDNNVKIPSRTRAILYNEESPVNQMVESINGLAKIGADFVAVPCNSAHFFYDEVTPQITIPWPNIVQITSEVLKQAQKKHPLILGGYVTVEKKIYSKYLDNAAYLDTEGNNFIMEIIEEIKLTNALSFDKTKRFREILRKRRGEIDSVVLACTELPIIFSEDEIEGFSVIDPDLEYAKAVVHFAKS